MRASLLLTKSMKKKLDFFLFPLVATNILHGPLQPFIYSEFYWFWISKPWNKTYLKKYLEILRSCYKTNKLLQLDVRYFPEKCFPKGNFPSENSQVATSPMCNLQSDNFPKVRLELLRRRRLQVGAER